MDEATLDTGDELSAVNDMLSAIGESPVSSLEGDPNADVANCRRILAKINREIQAKGWTFNIEEAATLLPDSFSGLITYLGDYLKVTTTGGSLYVNRGGFLFDRVAKTDVFAGPIQADLIRLRSYEEMPECFRTYIVARAARRFNMSFFGAGEIEGSLAEQEAMAWADIQTYELDYGNFNMLDGDAFTGGQIGRG